jgi:signal transduction histidine kinase
MAEQLGTLNDPQRKMLATVSRNGRRLLALIEDLLTLSSVEQRDFTVVAERLDLRTAVRRGCAAVAARAEAASVRLDLDLGPDPVLVIGDADQLERLTVNLLGNAVKFSPAGSVVRASVDRQDGEAVLTVADRGMGIPRDEVPHLFDRFFRSSNARRAEVQGSGLGLAIVKEVVDHHDGRIEVASEEGVGTTVRARLPLQAPATSPSPSRPA